MNYIKLKNIETLPEEFIGSGEVRGFIFKRVFQSQVAYIYEVLCEKGTKTYYEVFLRKMSPVCLNFEKREYSDREFKEIYPKAKDFGVWAWTTPDYKKALSIAKSYG